MAKANSNPPINMESSSRSRPFRDISFGVCESLQELYEPNTNHTDTPTEICFLHIHTNFCIFLLSALKT